MRKDSPGFYMERGNAKEINLKDYFILIKKRFWIVALIAILTTMAGYYYSSQNNTLLYQTSTRIIIGTEASDMTTLLVMIKDPIMMENVQKELELNRSPEAIASQVEVTRIDESRVIQISVTDKDPKMAMDIANATAQSFKTEVVDILGFSDVQLLSAAKENRFPINDNNNKIVIAAAVFGIIIGLGLIFLMDTLDDTVKSELEVEKLLGVPVLGVVSNMNKRKLLENKSNKLVHEKEVVRSEPIGIKKSAVD